MRALSPWKSSIMSFSFFPNPLTTDVLVRSADDPGPHPGKLRFAAFDRSSASSFPFITFTRFSTSATSLSIRARTSFIALAVCAVLLSSFASCSLLYSISTLLMSSFTSSTSSKNLSRFTLSFPASTSSRSMC
ncbi:hypothetical protein VIGAN_01132700 [Vigna angularis var. angularis]|uniref:Uncharacterized protein n=1 Tax=Vigna angularis var. angularis TaxID=157739 RepID=A0A0S3QZK3_PHAAN|nr:hypothetical protein VIGAN_01132700 [Vigna angularis var. angularis]